MSQVLDAKAVFIKHPGVFELDAETGKPTSASKEYILGLSQFAKLNTTPVPTDNYGHCVNGTCSGIWGFLQRGDADYAVVSTSILGLDEHKLSFVDMIGSSAELRSHVATAAANSSVIQEYDILKSLYTINYKVLATFFAMTALALMVFKQVAHLRIKRLLFNYCRILLRQSQDLNSKRARKTFFRIFVLFLTVSSFLLVSVATNLISTEMVVRVPGFLINTLIDLINSDKKMIFVEGSGSIETFEAATSGIIKEIWERPGRVRTISENVSFILKSIENNYALADISNFIEIMKRISCLSRLDSVAPTDNIYSSPEPYAAELWVNFMRSNLDIKMKRRLQRGLRRKNEIGITQYCQDNVAKRVVSVMFANNDIRLGVKVDHCLAAVSKKTFISRITYRSFRSLIFCLTISQAIVLCFTSASRFVRRNKRKKKHRTTNYKRRGVSLITLG